MQIDRVLFPITTLGPNKRIGIWTIGCPHKCYKCSNPELWETDESKDIRMIYLISHIAQYKDNAEGVTITGGDPFLQSNELYELLKGLREIGFEDILVYTGYTIKEISEKYPHILNLIDVLIDEPYIDALNNNVGIMGSSNQKIHILNPNMTKRYKNMEKSIRNRQNYVFCDKIISVGIPDKILDD